MQNDNGKTTFSNPGRQSKIFCSGNNFEKISQLTCLKNDRITVAFAYIQGPIIYNSTETNISLILLVIILKYNNILYPLHSEYKKISDQYSENHYVRVWSNVK